MTGLEFWKNGEKLGVASLKQGMIIAKLVLRNQIDPIWFDVDGRDQETGGHVHWSHVNGKAGDEFVIRIVEV